MGSAGSGNLTDYPGSSGGRPGGGGGGGGSGGGGGDGGKSDDDARCAKPLNGVQLEEVATAEYYTAHKSLPRLRAKVRVRSKLVSKRIAVELETSSEVIGYLPTKYNHVVSCMKQGWEYSGNVVDTSEGKLPKVKVDLTAKK